MLRIDHMDSGRIGDTMHPFKKWKQERGLTLAEIAQMVAAERNGKPLTDDYLRFIMNGQRRPSWDVAKVLSQLTGGEIAPEAFMEYGTEKDAA